MHEKILQQETVYCGRQFTLKKLQVRLPDGQEAQRDVIRHPGAVAIVAIDEQGRLLLVRQFRIAAGETGNITLELPAGTLESNEAPLLCAQRELREETGYRADSMRALGGFYVAPGYTSEFIEIFLASQLQHDPLPGDADEFIALERMSIPEALEAVDAGRICDAKTIIGLWYATREYS